MFKHNMEWRRTGLSTLYDLINDILLLGALWGKGIVGPAFGLSMYCLSLTWLTLFCWRLRQRYKGRTILDNPGTARTDSVPGALQVGVWLLAVRMCSLQGELCHLCCSPGRKEECEHQSGSHQSFQYETSPTCDHWGLEETHGCYTEMPAVL